MDRFLIRNYGPTRNLPDGHGSYIFLEHDRVRPTNDEKMAKLFDTYPDVHVTDYGEDIGRIQLPQPPVGPPPPEDPEDKEVVEVPLEYEALGKRDLRDMCKLRGIPITGLHRDELIVALKAKDEEGENDDEGEGGKGIDYAALDYSDLQEIAKERGIRSVGISKPDLIASLKADDKK